MAAQEWSNQFNPARNDSTLVVPFPKDFDTKADIILPGKVSTFHRDLNAALATRGMLDVILEREPTLDDLAAANPGIHTSNLQW